MLTLRERAAGPAQEYGACPHVTFIGRVRGWPVAREGALKLKEVSYPHAEAYPASELKHGPLALISPENTNGDRIATRSSVRENATTIEEIRARGGPVLAITQEGALPLPVDGGFEVSASEPEL